MRKFLCFSVIFILIFSMTIGIFATEKVNPTILLETKQEDDILTLTLFIKNNPGISSLKLNIQFDKDLTLNSIKYNDDLNGMVFTPEDNYFPKKSSTILNWVSLENVNGDFTFATLTFKLNTKYISGKHTFNVIYDEEDIFDKDLNNISFVVAGQTFELTSQETTTSETPTETTNITTSEETTTIEVPIETTFIEETSLVETFVESSSYVKPFIVSTSYIDTEIVTQEVFTTEKVTSEKITTEQITSEKYTVEETTTSETTTKEKVTEITTIIYETTNNVVTTGELIPISTTPSTDKETTYLETIAEEITEKENIETITNEVEKTKENNSGKMIIYVVIFLAVIILAVVIIVSTTILGKKK